MSKRGDEMRKRERKIAEDGGQTGDSRKVEEREDIESNVAAVGM